jgi:hypothetical protein
LSLGRYYQLADGSTQMIEEQAAWCETCGRITAAEQPRPLPDLERELAELRSGSGPMHDWLRALDIPVEREVGELEERLGWRGQRSSSARCLECGSETIVPLPSEGEAVPPGSVRTIQVVARTVASRFTWTPAILRKASASPDQPSRQARRV